MKTFYNEFDKNAAQWLRNLMAEDLIAKGEVDERSIKELSGADLAGYGRAHFFAGIGGWDLALRLAGWPDDAEVWTGSCPCQPFSSAGKGKGTADERHLWPDFFRLIRERRPNTVFGEQVGSKAGLGWLDGVFADLESEGYACGAVVIGAHSVGAPHIRQRLYWVADALRGGARYAPRQGLGAQATVDEGDGGLPRERLRLGVEGSTGGLGQDPAGLGRPGRRDGDSPRDDGEVQAEGLRAVGGMADDDDEGQQGAGCQEQDWGPEPLRNSWADFRIVPCTDGKARRCPGKSSMPESVFQSLVDGLPALLGDSWTAYSKKVEEKIKAYAHEKKISPEEVVLALWRNYGTQALQWEVGGSNSVYSQKVLLFALRQYARELGVILIGPPSGISQAQEVVLREVRGGSGKLEAAPCPPQGPRPPQQPPGELSDLMYELSHEGASCLGAHDIAQALAGFPLAMRIPSRVGMLKGSGNAIVPELAARFVMAYMEARGIAPTPTEKEAKPRVGDHL